MTLINITQENIDSGTKGNCYLCPVALAISDAFDMPTDDVFAGPLSLEAGKLKVFTPRQAKRWMEDFDSNQQVEPFSFEVEFKDEPLWTY